MDAVITACCIGSLVGVYCSGYIAGALAETRRSLQHTREMVKRADEMHAELVKAFTEPNDPASERGQADE